MNNTDAAALAFDAAFLGRTGKLGIRPETLGDAFFLQRLFAHCSPLRDALPPELLHIQARTQDDSYRTEHPDAMRRVATLDGQPIARFIIDWTKRDDLYGIDLAVDPDFRTTGAGLHLLRAWCNVADALRQRATLCVAPNNPARRIYIRLGFVDTFDADRSQPMLFMARPPRRD